MFHSPQAAKEFFDALEEKRPSVGRLVTVNQSVKKYAGRVGVVSWHGVDKFAKLVARDELFRVGGHADVSRGTYGFRVRIQPVDGGAPFFVDADKVSIAIRMD